MFKGDDEETSTSKPTYADKVKYGLKRRAQDTNAESRFDQNHSKQSKTSWDEDKSFKKRYKSRSRSPRHSKARNRRSRTPLR